MAFFLNFRFISVALKKLKKTDIKTLVFFGQQLEQVHHDFAKYK